MTQKLVVSGNTTTVLAILEELANNALAFSEKHLVPVVLLHDAAPIKKGKILAFNGRFRFINAYDDQAVIELQAEHGDFFLADSIEKVRKFVTNLLRQEEAGVQH